jgi:lipopolysaccharide biosynthesis glycosyltransferase
MPRDPRNRPRTAFSFSRFHIPALCGYQGRALYLDADMQVFDDISALWDIDFAGAKVLCTNQPDVPEQWKGTGHFHPGRQMSVMMLDCSALPWDVTDVVRGLDEGLYTYEQLMFEMCLLKPDEVQDALPPTWNHLERYEPGRTQLLHYTVVPTQPWKNDANPLRQIWEAAFADAWQDHTIDDDLLDAQIRRGHAKASLRALAPPRPKPVPHPPASALEAELRETRSRLDALTYAETPIDVRRHLRAALRRRLGRSL